MKTYTVKDVAQMLHTNPETVRRWIRSNRLGAEILSDKGGHIISEEALRSFVKTTPKYAPFLTVSAPVSSMALSVVLGTLLGGLVLATKEKKVKKVTATDVQESIDKRIGEYEREIAEKEHHLEMLKAELAASKMNLEKYKAALDELDLEVVATEVNKELGGIEG